MLFKSSLVPHPTASSFNLYDPPGELKEEKRLLKAEAMSQGECKVNELGEEILSLKQSLSDSNEELKFCRVSYL